MVQFVTLKSKVNGYTSMGNIMALSVRTHSNFSMGLLQWKVNGNTQWFPITNFKVS